LPSLHSFPTRRSSDLLFDSKSELMDLMRNAGWTPVFGRRSSDNRRSVHQLLRAPGLTTGHVFLDRKQSWDLSSTIWLSHVLWSRDRKSTRLNSSHVAI